MGWGGCLYEQDRIYPVGNDFKYEVTQIKQIVHSIDPNAFMIFTEGCSVDGNFEKWL